MKKSYFLSDKVIDQLREHAKDKTVRESSYALYVIQTILKAPIHTKDSNVLALEEQAREMSFVPGFIESLGGEPTTRWSELEGAELLLKISTVLRAKKRPKSTVILLALPEEMVEINQVKKQKEYSIDVIDVISLLKNHGIDWPPKKDLMGQLRNAGEEQSVND